ncbi:APC family permease [Nostoc sp. CMAA1605]|uniref:APC family permease n=1 Tax=Nostoc sp. CMAA1605 TaxID=2055159 RepID=UPI001F200A0B|nr:APC family permease [Nostoc sp. CMAA1605]MCF4969329.1 amino acid permease [Nostoc sp. CMAA1605]
MTAEIELTQSVHGLKKECLSYGEVLAQSIAVIAPTTTPAANLGLIYASAGNGTWLSFLIGMMGLMFVAVNINQFARRSASPGSLYSYIVKGLGVTSGVLSAWGLVLAYLFTGMSTLCGFAIFGQSLLTHIGIHTHVLTLFALGTVLAWYVAYKDIQLSAKMMLLLEAFSIGLILVLGLIIWLQKGFAFDISQLTLQGATPGGVSLGVVLVVFGFSGFESATSLGDEAKKPLKNIPKSVMQSAIWTGVFFMIMAYIEVLGFRGSAVDLAKTEEPLSFLAEQAGVGFLGTLISVGALLSFFACVLACINPAARVLFMMARHGLFHTSLGKAHGANLTPHTAIALCSLITFIIPATLNLLGIKPFVILGYTGTICTYGFLLVYILVSVAAPVYLHRLGKLRSLDLAFSVLAVLFMMIPIIGTLGIPGSDLFPVPPSPYNIFPYLFLLYLLAGFGWFMIQRLRYPKMVKKLEHSIDAIHASFSDVE